MVATLAEGSLRIGACRRPLVGGRITPSTLSNGGNNLDYAACGIGTRRSHRVGITNYRGPEPEALEEFGALFLAAARHLKG